MNHEERREQLRQRTAKKVVSLRHAAQRLEARRSEPLEAGDLVVSPQTKDLPVEWLVLEKIGTNPAWLVVAPVDTMALYGSADVRLMRADTGGPVIARCGHTVRIGAGLLSSRTRTGRVNAASLELALSSYRDSDRPAAQGLTDGVSSQPDYQDWIEDVVLPAQDRLRGEVVPMTLHRMAPDSGPRPVAVPEFPGPRPRDLLQLYQIAAALFLAVALALAAGWFTDHRELTRLTGGGGESSQTDHVAVAFLAPQEPLRGQAEILELPESAQHFVLVLFLDPAWLFDHYRVEILADSGREPVWRSADLARGKDAHLGLRLQRQTLPNGRYRLRLEGLGEVPEPAAELIAEVSFEIVNE